MLKLTSMRSAPQHLFPTLGQDITERQYGTDCRLYISGEGINWPVIRDTMDEFVIAHTVRFSWRRHPLLAN